MLWAVQKRKERFFFLPLVYHSQHYLPQGAVVGAFPQACFEQGPRGLEVALLGLEHPPGLPSVRVLGIRPHRATKQFSCRVHL